MIRANAKAKIGGKIEYHAGSIPIESSFIDVGGIVVTTVSLLNIDAFNANAGVL